MITPASSKKKKASGTRNQFSLPIVLGIIVVLVLLTIGAVKHKAKKHAYKTTINPQQFSSTITNKYFQLTPGKTMTYRGTTAKGIEIIETYVTHEKKMVMGVETTVVWDRVWVNGELAEDTRDWYAQDSAGNVWYFGEESKEMSGGAVVSTHGSWEAGVDGAKPGIIMKAEPSVGETIQEEYYAGQAEDRADILAIDATASVPFGQFDECVQTKNYTPLDPKAIENKYYCPDAGGIVLETDEDGERVELVSIEFNTPPSANVPIQDMSQSLGGSMQPKGAITEEQAQATALRRVPGKVTDVATEVKFGKKSYVIEIIPKDSSTETDVVIDMTTGEVLGVE